MIIRAKYLVDHAMTVIENAAMRIEKGRIAEIGPAAQFAGEKTTDLGECVLLPGFVNAHTHLELSFAAGKVPPSPDFADWLRRLMAVIRAAPDIQASLVRGVEEGLRQSISAGTTLLGDITRQPAVTRATVAWRKAAPAMVSFGEVIAFGGLRGRASTAIATACDETHAGRDLRIGISPHAPYTVEPDVLAECVLRASMRHLRLCVHAAETEDEERYLLHGDGPLRDFLAESGFWDYAIPMVGCRPIAYLDRAGVLGPSTLIAHANYVNAAEIDHLAATGASVAYCPRTHAAFVHRPHPFRRMLERGVNVCLGTDSLASNPCLSVLEEMRFLRRNHADLPAAAILRMGTRAGAIALGWDADTGELREGLRADVTAVPLDAAGPHDPLENVLRSGHNVSACYVAGKRLWG